MKRFKGDSPIFADHRRPSVDGARAVPATIGTVPSPPSCSSASRLPLVFSLAVCFLGLSAFLTQLVLMRELVSAFSGNELVFGIVLGNWMLLMGIGSTLGKTAARLRSPITVFIAAEVLIALLPIADVFLLRWLRNVVFLRGSEVGVFETVTSCFVALAPYCLVTGYALTVACTMGSAAPRACGPTGLPACQPASVRCICWTTWAACWVD